MVYNIFMDAFSALADPTRRKIIEILATNGQLSASEICEKFPVSPPAISQHLKVLREAKLVHMEKRAQQRIYRLNPEALLALGDWTKQITQLWNQRFDALEKVLEAEKKKNFSGIERTSDMEYQIGREINLTRTYDAPRELVFRAFTDARLLAEWFGPNMFTNPVCEVDARPGGAILIHMRGPDGIGYPCRGLFKEISAPERLVFTTSAFEDQDGHAIVEILNTVTLSERNGKTELRLQAVVVKMVKSTPEIAAALDGWQEGWSQSFGKLAGTLPHPKEQSR